jgi:phage tail sheath gpL-like
MAQCYQTLIVSHDSGVSADIQNDLYAENGYRELASAKIVNYAKQVTSGARPAAVKTRIGAVKASGTVTLSSHVATDTVTINGTTFTCVSSGATGNQYNVGGNDTSTAVNLAAAINASATSVVVDNVYATAASGVVTVTAIDPGTSGNQITLAISAHGSVSGARATGGTNGDKETTHYFGSTAVTGISNF